MMLLVEAPTFDLTIVSLKQKTHISFRDGQLNGIHLLISIRMMTLKMEINSEYQNVKTKRYICGICIVLSLFYSTKYNFLLAVLPFYRYSKIEDGYI